MARSRKALACAIISRVASRHAVKLSPGRGKGGSSSFSASRGFASWAGCSPGLRCVLEPRLNVGVGVGEVVLSLVALWLVSLVAVVVVVAALPLPLSNPVVGRCTRTEEEVSMMAQFVVLSFAVVAVLQVPVLKCEVAEVAFCCIHRKLGSETSNRTTRQPTWLG